VYWNPKTLAPGETREYVTYYGLSELTQDLRPPLALSVSGASSVEATPDGTYSPNPFTVTAYILNNGQATALNTSTSINLPEGLRLTEEEELEKSLGNLEVGQERIVSWKVQIDPSSVDRTLNYNVVVKADNTENKIVTKSIEIPKVAIAEETLDAALSLHPGKIKITDKKKMQIIAATIDLQGEYDNESINIDSVVLNKEQKPTTTFLTDSDGDGKKELVAMFFVRDIKQFVDGKIDENRKFHVEVEGMWKDKRFNAKSFIKIIYVQ
jgi:hypothetical protein